MGGGVPSNGSVRFSDELMKNPHSSNKSIGMGYGEERNNQTSMELNLILDSDGQVDDYFNADKNPFQQRGMFTEG